MEGEILEMEFEIAYICEVVKYRYWVDLLIIPFVHSIR